MTEYKKISADEYEVIELMENVRTVNLSFLETDILHKDKLIAELQEGITKLQAEKAELEILKTALLKVK